MQFHITDELICKKVIPYRPQLGTSTKEVRYMVWRNALFLWYLDLDPNLAGSAGIYLAQIPAEFEPGGLAHFLNWAEFKLEGFWLSLTRELGDSFIWFKLGLRLIWVMLANCQNDVIFSINCKSSYESEPWIRVMNSSWIRIGLSWTLFHSNWTQGKGCLGSVCIHPLLFPIFVPTHYFTVWAYILLTIHG